MGLIIVRKGVDGKVNYCVVIWIIWKGFFVFFESKIFYLKKLVENWIKKREVEI